MRKNHHRWVTVSLLRLEHGIAGLHKAQAEKEKKEEKGDGDEEEVVKEEERLKRAWRWETGRRRGREGLERAKSGENG